MKFDVFLDNRYQELLFAKNEAKGEFDPLREAEIKATQEIRSAYLTALKWVTKPKVLVSFVRTRLQLEKEPEPVLLNEMKRLQKEKEKKDKAEKK